MNWKCIGILANTAEGAAICYRQLVQLSSQFVDDGSHPEIVLHQHSFHRYQFAMEQLAIGNSTLLIETLLSAAQKLKKAGAEILIIPANSSHLVYEEFSKHAPLPTLSIVHATHELCVEKGFQRPLVLGTRWTIEKKLYGSHFHAKNGFEVFYPTPDEQEAVHQIIFKDLIAGKIPNTSREELYQIVEKNKTRHRVDSIILGCTELPLIFDERSPLPFADSIMALVFKTLRVSAGLHDGR